MSNKVWAHYKSSARKKGKKSSRFNLEKLEGIVCELAMVG